MSHAATRRPLLAVAALALATAGTGVAATIQPQRGASGAAVAAPGGWTIRELKPLAGASSLGSRLNNSGQVAGWSSTANVDAVHAVVWRAGTRVDLGTLGGLSSGGNNINENGEVSGWSLAASGARRATLWSGGKAIDLGTLGGVTSSANDLNESGTVVGDSTTGKGDNHAFRWTKAAGMKDLGTLGGRLSSAWGINAAGAIVGATTLAAAPTVYRAAIWEGDRTSILALPAGYTSSFAYGVSLDGSVTGYLGRSGAQHAFVSSGGATRDIGALPGYAYARGLTINGAGQVVGRAFNTVSGPYRPFLWRPGKAMIDLNSVLPKGSKWALASAYANNDLGQITGDGTLSGQERGFVLTPPKAEQAANVRAFVLRLQPGTTLYERKTAALLAKAGAALGGGRKVDACIALASAARLTAGAKIALGALRQTAASIDVAALRASVGC